MMLVARQRSRSAAFAKAGHRSRSGDHETAVTAVASGPILLRERDGGGGRNARATSTRLRAFPECPPAIHPRESPAAAGSAAIIRQAQENSTFLLNPLCARLLRLATGNSPTLVQKLWTMRIPCGKPRKSQNKPAPHGFSPRRVNNLDAVKGSFRPRTRQPRLPPNPMRFQD